MREFLQGLDFDDETIDCIMAEHGKLMTRNVEKISKLTKELETLQKTEREKAEKEMLTLLGVDSKEKLKTIKERYEATLSEEEKIKADSELFRTERSSLETALREKDLTITALSVLSKSSGFETEKIIRMAKGLIDDDTTPEEAVEQVLELLKPQTETLITQPEEPATSPQSNVPVGVQLLQPDPSQKPVEVNPWKPEHYNLDAQGRILKENKDRARVLAKAAGVKVNW